MRIRGTPSNGLTVKPPERRPLGEMTVVEMWRAAEQGMDVPAVNFVRWMIREGKLTDSVGNRES